MRRIIVTKPTLKRLLHYPVIPMMIVLAIIITAIFGSYFAPQSPMKQDLGSRLAAPSMKHHLGTDALGRDVLSRIIYGARVSLLAAALSICLGGLVGLSVGVLAGYLGGRTDAVLMRAADAMLSFPIILIALILAVTLGPSFQNVIIAIGVAIWARYARIIRGEVLSLKEQDFVALSKVAGWSPLRIMALDILPNVLNTFVVLVTLQVGWVVLVEATLSFLGAGIPPPSPSWGSMISDGRQYINTAWWVSFFPGVALLILALSFNLLGDWLREALDPRLRQGVM